MLFDDGGERLHRADLRKRIETLITARERHYREADQVVDVTGLSVAEAVSEVVGAIGLQE
jgi:hypothetical protein